MLARRLETEVLVPCARYPIHLFYSTFSSLGSSLSYSAILTRLLAKCSPGTNSVLFLRGMLLATAAEVDGGISARWVGLAPKYCIANGLVRRGSGCSVSRCVHVRLHQIPLEDGTQLLETGRQYARLRRFLNDPLPPTPYTLLSSAQRTSS